MDLSQPLSRLRRYLDRWNDRAEKELKHIVAACDTVAYNLTFITFCNDAWKNVRIFTDTDSNFASPRNDGGRLIVWLDPMGAHIPMSGGQRGRK